ncbi:hypothetical protein EVAR_61512_1 [Eumeta japonica]|uniref:Uncharacterized protein n=1 Tax=Eumeta variegata TaxID=151549 RepID=A0A4C2A6D0_EUMVA|nr:hypothetical protein EVAR_61512_1 [Eumeta japonica]
MAVKDIVINVILYNKICKPIKSRVRSSIAQGRPRRVDLCQSTTIHCACVRTSDDVTGERIVRVSPKDVSHCKSTFTSWCDATNSYQCKFATVRGCANWITGRPCGALRRGTYALAVLRLYVWHFYENVLSYFYQRQLLE